MEPWWNLASGPARTTPEPIWAETSKLSAVGEKVGNLILTSLLGPSRVAAGGQKDGLVFGALSKAGPTESMAHF